MIFVDTPTEVRMKRLREREFKRYGERILEGGDMYEGSVQFLKWSEEYDDVDAPPEGRSRIKHEEWLRGVRVPVMRLPGDQEESVLVSEVLKVLERGDEKGGE